jgi:hypothetical protein
MGFEWLWKQAGFGMGGRFFRKVDGMVRGEEWRRGVEQWEWAGRVWFEARLLRM